MLLVPFILTLFFLKLLSAPLCLEIFPTFHDSIVYSTAPCDFRHLFVSQFRFELSWPNFVSCQFVFCDGVLKIWYFQVILNVYQISEARCGCRWGPSIRQCGWDQTPYWYVCARTLRVDVRRKGQHQSGGFHVERVQLSSVIFCIPP